MAVFVSVRKEEKSKPIQLSCKKRVLPQKGQGEKGFEIKGGSQEMAVMVG